MCIIERAKEKKKNGYKVTFGLLPTNVFLHHR